MYGHLGRDPMPLFIMQAQAVNVFRCVEEMNRPAQSSIRASQGPQAAAAVQSSVPSGCGGRTTTRIFAVVSRTLIRALDLVDRTRC